MNTAPAEAASRRHSILFVDDEQNILNSVQRLLRKSPYHVLTANNAEAGLELLRSHHVTLVVSDFRMPDLDGVSFLQKVQKVSPDTVRILLTGFADADSAIRAINSGQVFRYLKKPIRENELLEALQTGIRQYELIAENRRLLELTRKQNEQLRQFTAELEKKVEERTRALQAQKKQLETLYSQLDASFTDTIRAFITVLEMKNPVLGGHSRRVAAMVRRFGEHMKLPASEIRELEVAALLHDIGKITLPDSILETPENQLNEKELSLLRAHPEFGAGILADIKSLEKVARIVEAHHESYNGRGYPRGMRGNNIPKGARVLAVINAFDNLLSKDQLQKQLRYELAVKYLQSESGGHFDPVVVSAFLNFLKTGPRAQFERGEKPMHLADLRPGMVLAREVKTISGLLLLGKDQQLNAAKIKHLKHYDLIDPIDGPVYITPVDVRSLRPVCRPFPWTGPNRELPCISPPGRLFFA